MTNLNHLDAVWAAMPAADRFVLLGHDRDYLDETDKARLSALAAAKANRATEARRPSSRRGRRNRTPA